MNISASPPRPLCELEVLLFYYSHLLTQLRVKPRGVLLTEKKTYKLICSSVFLPTAKERR